MLPLKELYNLSNMLELEPTETNLQWIDWKYSDWYFYMTYKNQIPLSTFKIKLSENSKLKKP